MPKQVFIESRNKTLEFPDEATQDQINDAVTAMFPPTGEDMMNHVEQAKNAALEGQSSINPVDSMSNDNYVLFNNHLADKKTSLGNALGIAKDTFTNIIDEVGTGIKATAYTLGQGEVAKAAESAGAGMVAGTVGLTDLAAKVFNPRQHIPTKEEFIGKPITRLVDQPQKEGVTGLTYAWPREEQDVANEDDYKRLIEEAKQRDADSINRLYAMELTMRGAPVEEIARGFQYVDPTILAGAASAAIKTGASLFSKIGAKAAAKAAATTTARTAAVDTIESGAMRPFVSTAPNAVTQAGLSAIEGTAGAIQGAASIPSRVIQGVGQVAEAVMPGTSVGAKAAALTGAAMSDAGLTAGVIGGAKATEKAAEVVGAAARIAKQEASRAGKLERVALDQTVSAPARRLAAVLAQVQPIASAAGRMAGQALKEGAKGAVVGGVIGGLAERNLEGVAAGMGAGTAFGGMFGAMHGAFDLGKEVLGRSTSRTRQQATGDINTFISTRPEIEQGAWADTMNKLVAKVGPERAASQMDAMRVAEAAGSKVRIATLDEINQGLAPGWLNVATNEIVLNPAKILADTAAHEATHALFNSVISRAFRPEIETAIYGIADPVTGQIVKPGVFDDVALGKIAEQIRDAYGKNTIAANEFQGFANTLKNSTDPASLSNARSRIADEMTAAYTGKLFDRSRAGRFNPDRLPLVYRKVLSSIEDGVLDKFKSVLYEKGMDLGFDNVSKTFRNDKGKPIRIPEIDAIVRKAFAQKLNAKDATTAKPDLIPTKPADRVLWAKTYGGARGILNDDGTPKSQKQIDAEAAARWQDMTMRLSALPDSEKIGIDFNRDKSGKTVMTAKGQLSPSAINAILDSGALDPTAKAVLVEILNSMQNAEKSTFDTRYYGVYTRGKGGNKMVAGVKSASQNEILPYSVEINSKDGVLIRAVDMSKVRDRLATAMNKPQFKAAYSNPADAIKDLRRYMENITQINAVDSATLLGGGAKGAMKRNLFYEALGFRLRNGETLLNAPDSVINKSQNTIKSYRAERFAKLVDSGYKFGFEEATSLERATRNFQPDAFTPEPLPNGEAYTNKEGWRILNKTGSKLFRTYDDTGKLIGVYDSKDKAVKSAFNAASKEAAKEKPANIRFQFAGEAAEMPKFMRDSLETAKTMAKEGKDSETIRAITGWFPGKYDDKMRWEVPDQEARYLPATKQWGKGSDQWAANLDEIIDHPALFEAYPEARQIRVSRLATSEPQGGSFSSSSNRISLNALKDNMENFSTLLHEVQHWIQNKEGFAKGGNLETGANAIVEAKTALQRGVKSDVEVMRQKHKDAAPDVMRNNPEFAQRAITKWRQRIPEDRKASPFGMDDVDLVAAELMDQDALLNRLSKQAYKFERVAQLNPEDAYRRFAGEIESRDIQARQSFTPEQRKAIAPYSSENIAKDEAIVLKNADKANAEMRFQPVTPEQDAAFLAAAKSGDTKAAEKIMLEAAMKAGAVNDAEYLYHGGSGIKKSFEAGASRSGMGHAYLTNNKQAAWKYAMGGGIDDSKSLSQYRREQLKQMPSRDPQVQRLFILGDVMDFSEFKYRPTAEKLIDVFGEDVMKKRLNKYSSEARQALEDGDSLEDVLSRTLDEGGWLQEDTDATKNVPELQVLQGMGLLDKYLEHYGKNVVSYNDAEAGGKTYVVFDSNKIKSADPVTYDDAGNIIPLSQRFNQASPDIRFQPDPTSPNILNGSNGSRIIKSNSGKYRVYLATGALAGVKDTLESAQKLIETKSKSYAPN